MKNTFTFTAFFFLINTLSAQSPDYSARCKAEMQKLNYLVGDWQGDAVYRGKRIQQTEHIESRLQGMALVIEGTGKAKNAETQLDEITFQALAIVNFDPTDQQFKFKSFVKEGFSTNAYFNIVTENKFEWGFEIPNGGKTRYTIILDPSQKTWYELGEYSRDGTTWMKSIELNLVKR